MTIVNLYPMWKDMKTLSTRGDAKEENRSPSCVLNETQMSQVRVQSSLESPEGL